ncbi:Mitogen-activated protein kinase 14 [Channa argus]|uniref:Mitogen-activated protein kinase 14 n=1 Tax=Channa argus TaxID=215402 RepID=A0A6G1PA27_CHAAH|nr:Mitogen-activated protein kinase 14 [Channa argus]
MITGQVLFPGHDCIDQLKKILKLTGTSNPLLIQRMQSKDEQSYVQSLRPQKKKNFREVFSSTEKKFFGAAGGDVAAESREKADS